MSYTISISRWPDDIRERGDRFYDVSIAFDVECCLLELVIHCVHRFESIVFEDLFANLIPDVLLRVEFRRIWGQGAQCDVAGDHKVAADMIASTIHKEQDMRPRILLGQSV